MSNLRPIIAVLSLFAIAAGTWTSYRLVAPPPAPRTATVLPQSAEVPQFTLVDQSGKPFTRDTFRGHWNLVFFGFTHCPDVCPLTLQVLASARRQLVDADQQPLPRIVLFSVDPQRDTPAVLAKYVAHFDSDLIGVTGQVDELRKLTTGLGVFFQRANGEDDNYLVDHSAAVLVIDPDARLRALFSAPHAVDSFVNDLPLIVAAR